MMYRLIAINIDGTLLKPNGRLMKATKEAIQFAKNKEIHVTLVTRRNYLSAKKIAKSLKLEDPIITHSGGFIASSIDEPVFEHRLGEEKTFNLVQILENFDCNIRLLHERFSLGNRVKQKNGMFVKTVLGQSDPFYYPIQFVDSLSDHLTDEPVSPPKIEVYFNDSDERQEVEQTLNDAYNDINVVYVNDNLLEILPSRATKVNGLIQLGDYLGIAPEEMVAIGDSYDDIEMIERVGLGVAMGDAPNEVKKAADWITRSNTQNGVGYMIKEHFRKQQSVTFLRKVKK